MAKTNIYFNGKDYSINDSALASAKDSLKNHFSTVMAGSGGLEPITWDGVIGDKATATIKNQNVLVKVSDKVLSKDDFIGSTMAVNNGQTMSLTDDFMTVISGGTMCGELVMCSVSDPTIFTEALYSMWKLTINFTEAGTYFLYNAEIGMYIASLTFPASSGSGGATTITFDGTTYQVDPTKLATITDDFVAHLETLKGGGLEPITWDGVVGEDDMHFPMPEAFGLYRVSSQVPSMNDLIGSTIEWSDGTTGIILQEMIEEIMGDYGDSYVGFGMYGNLIVIYNPTEIFGWQVEPGIYFGRDEFDGSWHVASLTFPNASSGPKFEVGETVTFKESYTMDDIPEEYWPAEGEEEMNTNLLIFSNPISSVLAMDKNGSIVLSIVFGMPSTAQYLYANNEALSRPDAEELHVIKSGWNEVVSTEPEQQTIPANPPSFTIEDQKTAEELAKFPFLFSSGGGNTKLTINGTEYLVDSSKLSNTITELQNHLETLSNL